MDKELLIFQRHALLGDISGVPLCADYKNEWRLCGEDKEALMKLVLRQQSIPFFINACYRGYGLDKNYITTAFADYINGKRQIYDADGVSGYTYELYTHYNGVLSVRSDVTAYMWCDDTVCEIQATKSPVLYVGAKSQIQLSLDGFNSPMVYLFDESELYISDADEESTVIVYKYSNDANVKVGKYCLAKVKVFNKQLKL